MVHVQLAAAAAAAPLYTGPPAWTFDRVFTMWQAEPVVLAIAVLGTAGYLLGMLRMHREGAAWRQGRTVAFVLGMALWVFTCCSGLGVYEKVVFTDRALQSVLLLMVVPLLLAMGAPVTVLVEAAPRNFRAWMRAALRGRVSQVLMFPLVSTVMLMVPPWLLFFSPWLKLSLTTDSWNYLFHVSFVLFGLAYFWPRLQIDPVGRKYPPLLGIVITIAEVLCDAALGFVLVFGGHLLVPDYWAQLHRPWGLSPLADQSWGGAVLWGLGDIAGVPFLVALIVSVIREDRLKTAEVDQQLDAEAAARIAEQAGKQAGERAGERAGSRTTGRAEPEAAAAPSAAELLEQETMRPWWLDDPNLAHRYGGANAAGES